MRMWCYSSHRMTRAKQTWQELLHRNLQSAKRPLVVVLGPTASGKTDFSLEVARAIGDAEVVNADSRQLYKYLDVGTAKISEEQMRGIPHHLLSALDPKETVTVGWYKREAERAIDDVLARSHVPLLIGGSMLYISAVTDGYVFTGRGGKRTVSVPYDILILGLRLPRAGLVQRIEERTRKLLRTWVAEVEWLLLHGYTTTDPGMEAHGYREIATWVLRGKPADEFPALEEDINAAMRQYAKRQVTWWRHDERIHWIDMV